MWNGALGKIRTPDPQIRSLVLYPAELRVHLLQYLCTTVSKSEIKSSSMQIDYVIAEVAKSKCFSINLTDEMHTGSNTAEYSRRVGQKCT